MSFIRVKRIDCLRLFSFEGGLPLAGKSSFISLWHLFSYLVIIDFFNELTAASAETSAKSTASDNN